MNILTMCCQFKMHRVTFQFDCETLQFEQIKQVSGIRLQFKPLDRLNIDQGAKSKFSQFQQIQFKMIEESIDTQIQINDKFVIDTANLLGKGSTGNVYLGWNINDPNKKYAVKAIDLTEINNQVTQYLLSCEIAALSQLSKMQVTSIVKLQDIAFLEGYCYLVMQLLEGGSLGDYIKQNPDGINEKQALQIFKQVSEAYTALKIQGIVHRDIKPDNLIFRHKCISNEDNRSSKQLCMIDFGYCTKENVPNRPKIYYNVGSPKYMSPQAYRDNIYSQKSDIWALGVILYEMLHGKTIDGGMDMDGYFDFMRQNSLVMNSSISQAVKNLLTGMLTFDHEKRYSWNTIKKTLTQIQKPVEIIPTLNIPMHSQQRRNSPFYRSDIMTYSTERSEPTNNLRQLLAEDHRRNKEISIQALKFREAVQNPAKKVFDPLNQKSLPMGRYPIFINNNQNIEKFQRNRNPTYIYVQNPNEIKQLSRIQEEQNQVWISKQTLSRNNSHGDLKTKYEMNRNFLKSIINGVQRPQMIQFKNGQNFFYSPNLPVQALPMRMQLKPNQHMIKSVILNNSSQNSYNPHLEPKSGPNLQKNTVLMFKQNAIINQNQNKILQRPLQFISQATEPPHSSFQIKQIKSDQLINQEQLNRANINTMQIEKNFKRIPSTKNLQQNIQRENINRIFINKRQAQVYHSPTGRQRTNQQLLLNNFQGNLAFLRNTLPSNFNNSYNKSMVYYNNGNTKIQPVAYFNRQIQDQKPRNPQRSIQKSPQQSQYKTRNQYFQSNTKNQQNSEKKVNNLQSYHNLVLQKNRREKSTSLRIINGSPNHNFTNSPIEPIKNLLNDQQPITPLSIYQDLGSRTPQNSKKIFFFQDKNHPNNHQGNINNVNNLTKNNNLPTNHFGISQNTPLGMNLQRNHQAMEILNIGKEHQQIIMGHQMQQSNFMSQRQPSNSITANFSGKQQTPQSINQNTSIFNQNGLLSQKQLYSMNYNKQLNQRGSFKVSPQSGQWKQTNLKGAVVSLSSYQKSSLTPNNLKSSHNVQFNKQIIPFSKNIGNGVAVTYH